MAEIQHEQRGRRLTLESAASSGPWGCRIDSVGVKLPAQWLTTKDLMSKTSHKTRIQLERLTGIHERRVVGPGENSFTLATGAARDCLAHSQHQAPDIEMLISTSSTRSRGPFAQSFEPSLSLSVKQAIGATQAVNFDLSNACAGMLTGVFILQDFVARGEISCGMVVSGEYISHLIPHQTSARAIRAGTREFARRLGAKPKHVVLNLEEYGNTSSTTLFVALHKYLEEQRIRIALAGCGPHDVDMLINVGMYREDNMGEPALAALIQEDIGANLGRPSAGRASAFSFDLLNGACGAVTVIQVESGLLKSGVIRLGAIVSSDVQPDLEKPAGAFLRPAGGAVLLGWREGFPGFTDFGAETFPEYEDLFTSGLMWRRGRGVRVPRQGTGGNQMVITVRPGYQARLADCAEEATRRFLRRLGLDAEDIDLLVPAPSAPDFVDPLRARLGIPGDRVAFTPEDLEGSYTTAPVAALQTAIKSGRLDEARTTLLLAAGPGVTVALALYRQTAP